MLVAPIRWLLNDIDDGRELLFDFIDLRGLPTVARTLSERIQTVLQQNAYDLLLVHRDAEKEGPSKRQAEVRDALAQALERMATAERRGRTGVPVVPVVPVRMSEAWLLFSERAIRRAARNPRSTVELDLPVVGRVESIPDPKDILHRASVVASGASGRRLEKFRPEVRVHDIQNWITDWSPLDETSAFRALREDLQAVILDIRIQ